MDAPYRCPCVESPSNEPDAVPQSPRITSLDGLRGLTSLYIALVHLKMEFEEIRPFVYRALILFHPGLGVCLFFMLSGFCLTLSIARRGERGIPLRYPAYLADRWRRVAIPYYVAIVLFLSISEVSLMIGLADPVPVQGGLSLRQVFLHALFLHGLWPDTRFAISAPFWALAPIFQFYLAFPLLIRLMGQFGPWRVVATAVASSIALRAVSDREGLLACSLPHFLPYFCVGMALAYWQLGPCRFRQAHLSPSWLVVASTVMLVVGVGLRPAVASTPVIGTGLTIGLAGVLLSADRGGLIARALGCRWLIWLGSISYSVYLTHMMAVGGGILFYRVVDPRPSHVIDAAFLVTITAEIIASSWIFHLLVERRLGRVVLRCVDGLTRVQRRRRSRLLE